MIEIIPAIDIIDGKCVRLSMGDYGRQTTYKTTPDDMVREFVDYGLTRIHAVVLTGARLGHPEALRVLEKMASVSGAMIEWGGGIKSDSDLRDLFNAGATWAVIGSVAAKDPDIFGRWLAERGGDTMILGADLRDGKVAVSGWLDSSSLTASDLVERFAPLGLSQVIVTDISRDGMLAGPSFSLYRDLMAAHPGMLFTASGGISCMDDIERLEADGVQRVIVGKALYEGRISIKDLC
ncbi:MAG: 1-(5-phosphoribosyl)-5-[(5-phosphoribosylamino)methylideneamino] imidazole-4-carboxamide isomerase [Duncaniella sp.]|nr:1-(5-phosphoribosyl)-5-[(5-phosphoribosylamino)methylideneamino] imidazole-4-carboxamide isomerase [Duncaniella sp.]